MEKSISGREKGKSKDFKVENSNVKSRKADAG